MAAETIILFSLIVRLICYEVFLVKISREDCLFGPVLFMRHVKVHSRSCVTVSRERADT